MAEKEKSEKGKLPRLGRDTLLLIAGIVGVFHETIVSDVDRPGLLILFSGMMGLPIFLRKDEREMQGGQT